MSSDLRFAFRQLAKSPGFTTVALLTLALGIGVNTSMFSVLNTLLLHQPPVPEPQRLMRVYRTTPTMQTGPHSPANFADLRDQAKSFTQLAAYNRDSVNLNEPGQPARQLPALYVSGHFFALLGVQPALGRFVTPEDDQSGAPAVVVLSDATWRQHFAADPAIVGRTIRLDSAPVTVIGVMPAGFEDPLTWGQVAVWRPHAYPPETRAGRGGNWLAALGRLKPGVSPEAALADLQAVNASLAAAYPATNAQTGINLVPFARSTQDKTSRQLTFFAMGLAGCVLLIACVNLANLLFARNVLRHREQAIRTALGASRARLIRQSLTESLVLAGLGGGAGLLVAVWGNSLLGAQLRIAGQNGFAVALDWQVAAFALVVSTFAGLGFGLLPALLASRTDVNSALKQGGRGSTTGAHHRVRQALIVAEVALALVLLSGAGFFLRGIDRFLTRDHGWSTVNLLTARLSLPDANYPKDEALAAAYERLEERLRALPGVTHVALAHSLPYYGFDWGQRFIVEGAAALTPGLEPLRDVNGVTPGYLATLGITLLEGRDFTREDLTGPQKTIISERMARQYWPGQSAIGKRIAHPTAPDEWQEIIGVTRDISFVSNLENPGRRPQTYRLLAREPQRGISVALRTSAPVETLAEPLRRAIAEVDAEIAISDLQAATRRVEENLSNYRLTGWMLAGFAGLGLLLAIVGLYGVISGFVTQRTGEIGIRMALGAQLRDILAMVFSQGLRLTLLGTVLGLGGAWWIARFLSSFMPAMPDAEPRTVVAVSALLIATSLFACWLPARRATKVDPIVALRAD